MSLITLLLLITRAFAEKAYPFVDDCPVKSEDLSCEFWKDIYPTCECSANRIRVLTGLHVETFKVPSEFKYGINSIDVVKAPAFLIPLYPNGTALTMPKSREAALDGIRKLDFRVNKIPIHVDDLVIRAHVLPTPDSLKKHLPPAYHRTPDGAGALDVQELISSLVLAVQQLAQRLDQVTERLDEVDASIPRFSKKEYDNLDAWRCSQQERESKRRRYRDCDDDGDCFVPV
jgi:hypothetical protein